jgi:uncharacterized protein (TIGR02679 family)
MWRRISSVKASVTSDTIDRLVVDQILAHLNRAGAAMYYHGDFDWPGVAITNRAIARHGVRPWRMTAEDYDRAVRAAGPELRGPVVEPVWDPELGPAMRRHGRAVHEESLLPDLLDALEALG